MAVLLITHDLGVVAGFTDRLAIMYAGRIVEIGPTEEVLAAPVHPYTLGLLRSLPRLDRDQGLPLASIPGSPPDMAADLRGCAFQPRCEYAIDVCASVDPGLDRVRPDHAAACHNPQGPLAGSAPG